MTGKTEITDPKTGVELTDLQRRFAEEYVVDCNVTQAAIRAGSNAKDPAVTGQSLLKNLKVKAEILRLQKLQRERTQIDGDWLLNRLVDEAQADLADLYTEHGDLKPIREWPKIWRQGLVQGLKVKALMNDAGDLIGKAIEIKLADRARRLELIGRHVAIGAFNDALVSAGGNVTINITGDDAKL